MKKLDYSRPMMFYQDAKGLISSYGNASRVRIIYPNGNVEWISLAFSGENYHNFINDAYNFGTNKPCYLNMNTFKNARQAIKFINKYDKGYEYQPMEFLGYL